MRMLIKPFEYIATNFGANTVLIAVR